jgi:hypothetical protein
LAVSSWRFTPSASPSPSSPCPCPFPFIATDTASLCFLASVCLLPRARTAHHHLLFFSPCIYRAAAGFGRSPPPTPTDFTFLATRRPQAVSLERKEKPQRRHDFLLLGPYHFGGRINPHHPEHTKALELCLLHRPTKLKQRWSRRRRVLACVPGRRTTSQPRPQANTHAVATWRGRLPA